MSENDKPGHGRQEPPADPEASLPSIATPAERFAALRADLAGLEEVCRWQWNLIKRMRVHMDLLPKDFPRQ